MFKNLFTNIGKKIKLTAKIVCWVTMLASFIGGIALLIHGCAEVNSGWGSDAEAAMLVAIGLIISLVAPFFCWVGSFMMYGFGELIDKATEIAENTKKNS